MTPTCRVCGRRLADPASRARGIGPTCARATGAHTRPHLLTSTHHLPTPRPDHHIDGQTELPLIHHQPTLWSV
ncbi:DUF6011 domain-containing protein [Streptomyces sp. MMS24-I29]|uniref:DUF6011 domain-containing protein n=1 Tax=Streptomyces sp. MMS24-I29 TaxID=3351480 RepID=UPI003C7D087D